MKDFLRSASYTVKVTIIISETGHCYRQIVRSYIWPIEEICSGRAIGVKNVLAVVLKLKRK